MPFGTYGLETCANPDCGAVFTKETPWQAHCRRACRNHHVYLRTTLPRRRRLQARLSGRRK
jgi:hypothetical protein